MYGWNITFRNDRMGFTKTFSVKAESYIPALELARALLIGNGYKREDFELVSLVRT